MFIKRFLFVFVMLFCLSCEEDDILILEDENCESEIELGEFPLLEESKSFIPYNEDITNIIFSDSLGKEYIGEVKNYNTGFTQAFRTENIVCNNDSSYSVRYLWSPEQKSIRVYFQELDIRISLTVRTILYQENYSNIQVADILNFVLFTPQDSGKPNSQMLIGVNERSHPMLYEDYSDFKQEFMIHGKLYNDVYIHPNNLNEPFDLYYSDLEGIIGFRSQNDSKIDLKFVRVE